MVDPLSIGTAIAMYCGYKSAAAATAAAAVALQPVVVQVTQATATALTLYVTSYLLEKSCADAIQFQQKYCNETSDRISCIAMKGKEIGACTASSIAYLGMLGEVVEPIVKTVKKIKT